MEKVKKYGKFLIAPVIAVAIALLIYAVKGIYPFGEMTIAHAEVGRNIRIAVVKISNIKGLRDYNK